MLEHVVSCHNDEDFEGGGSSRIISSRIVSVSHEKMSTFTRSSEKAKQKEEIQKVGNRKIVMMIMTMMMTTIGW